MGLDMYLFKKLKDTDSKMVEVMYWRKANQIRRWFDNNLPGNVANCKYTKVTKTHLEDLIATCEHVLQNPEQAEELLPTQKGYFFGYTGYDKWYFEDLKETIEGLNSVLEQVDWDNEIVFYSEWW